MGDLVIGGHMGRAVGDSESLEGMIGGLVIGCRMSRVVVEVEL